MKKLIRQFIKFFRREFVEDSKNKCNSKRWNYSQFFHTQQKQKNYNNALLHMQSVGFSIVTRALFFITIFDVVNKRWKSFQSKTSKNWSWYNKLNIFRRVFTILLCVAPLTGKTLNDKTILANEMKDENLCKKWVTCNHKFTTFVDNFEKCRWKKLRA